jgi:AraC family transcriptional regulator, regulatory protein of adaptative response / methylated-DNA-[protein]-cysteine methyltransferase
MDQTEPISYQRIAEAIDYIKKNFKEQPRLEVVAEHVNLSPFHFQRLFTEWAGVSPKKFLQYTSIQYAKQMLKDQQASLFDTAMETGLSGTGRLHDLFIHIEAMTPGEFKNGGESLGITYSYADSPFGDLIIASTPKGICYMAFVDDKDNALSNLRAYFPNASFHEKVEPLHQKVLSVFQKDWHPLETVNLHLKGTPFQLKVWETLLKIPIGRLSTYGKIAEQIQHPKASRAVGTAIGSNPVSFLIPCHRVIQSSGVIGGYMWGPTRKTAIIGWEAAQLNADGPEKLL